MCALMLNYFLLFLALIPDRKIPGRGYHRGEDGNINYLRGRSVLGILQGKCDSWRTIRDKMKINVQFGGGCWSC